MRESIHIFRKDALRCWPYVIAVAALMVLRTTLTPKWVPIHGPATETLDSTVELLGLLLPAALWFTVARLVHGEKLVGDRQFWITRPYSWKKLLASKILFCVVFLLAPFIISDSIILVVEGFRPSLLIPGLLVRYLFLSAILILAPLTLGSITAGMRQFVLICLILIAIFAALVALDPNPKNSLVDALSSPNPGINSSLKNWAVALLYPGAELALLLWQYARRQTAVSRAGVAALVVYALAPLLWPVSMPLAAPQQDRYREIRVSFAPNRGLLTSGGFFPRRSQVEIDIPIEFTGRNREFLNPELAFAVLTPSEGEPWKTRWNWYNCLNARGGDWLELHIDAQAYQRLSVKPVAVHAIFAVAAYETESTTKLRAGQTWTPVPGFGSVMPVRDGGSTLLYWRRSLHEGTERLVCSLGNSGAPAAIAEGEGVYPAVVWQFQFSPVVFFAVPFEVPGTQQNARVPPNAEGEVTLERPVALLRRDLDIRNLQLGDYVPRTIGSRNSNNRRQ